MNDFTITVTLSPEDRQRADSILQKLDELLAKVGQPNPCTACVRDLGNTFEAALERICTPAPTTTPTHTDEAQQMLEALVARESKAPTAQEPTETPQEATNEQTEQTVAPEAEEQTEQAVASVAGAMYVDELDGGRVSAPKPFTMEQVAMPEYVHEQVAVRVEKPVKLTDIQQKIIELAQKGKKAEMRTIIHEYGETATKVAKDNPEKLPEMYRRLCELDKEA